ncbi:conserved hypothetical protein [Ricinus communis]|uniref:Uncharacterized protein n=1 Tax=Ricinus communis TaxID=3988 RepID=B9S978_RICCO|nr:conserved hypothetical protein [Ricinus communis]
MNARLATRKNYHNLVVLQSQCPQGFFELYTAEHPIGKFPGTITSAAPSSINV